jgi:hypothetical protein
MYFIKKKVFMRIITATLPFLSIKLKLKIFLALLATNAIKKYVTRIIILKKVYFYFYFC